MPVQELMCPLCGGEQWVESDMAHLHQENSDEEGKLYSKKVKCPRCNGSGRVKGSTTNSSRNL